MQRSVGTLTRFSSRHPGRPWPTMSPRRSSPATAGGNSICRRGLGTRTLCTTRRSRGARTDATAAVEIRAHQQRSEAEAVRPARAPSTGPTGPGEGKERKRRSKGPKRAPANEGDEGRNGGAKRARRGRSQECRLCRPPSKFRRSAASPKRSEVPLPLMPFSIFTTFWSVSGGSRISWLINQGKRRYLPPRYLGSLARYLGGCQVPRGVGTPGQRLRVGTWLSGDVSPRYLPWFYPLFERF